MKLTANQGYQRSNSGRSVHSSPLAWHPNPLNLLAFKRLDHLCGPPVKGCSLVMSVTTAKRADLLGNEQNVTGSNNTYQRIGFVYILNKGWTRNGKSGYVLQ
jgi:hypothetical protein